MFDVKFSAYEHKETGEVVLGSFETYSLPQNVGEVVDFVTSVQGVKDIRKMLFLLSVRAPQIARASSTFVYEPLSTREVPGGERGRASTSRGLHTRTRY